jgi:hypothetical protein
MQQNNQNQWHIYLEASYVSQGGLLIRSKTLALALVSVLIGLGVVATLASATQIVAINTPLATENIVDDLELTMSLQKATFNIGEPINITFTVTNIGSQTISYTHLAPEFDFIVSNSSNSKLYQWSLYQMFPMITWVTPLDPGHNVNSTLTWPQTCNQTVYNNEGTPVSPGQYSIIGIFVHFNLQTSPIQVSIGAANSGTNKSVSITDALAVVGLGLAMPVVAILAAVLEQKRYRVVPN